MMSYLLSSMITVTYSTNDTVTFGQLSIRKSVI